MFQAEIDSRRNKSEEIIGKDILGLMMCAQDEDGNGLSDQELKDELMTLFISGYETTSISLSWTLLEIYKNPQIKEQLKQELNQLENKQDVMAIEKLPYLNAIISETLRMYPLFPVISPRITTMPVKIGEYTYPKETILCPSIYLVHYREDLYPQPDQFKPERFLNKQYTPYEYFPFGGGKRRCLGYALAQLEIKLIIVNILENHTLNFAPGFPPQDLKMKRQGIVLAPSQEIMMTKIA